MLCLNELELKEPRNPHPRQPMHREKFERGNSEIHISVSLAHTHARTYTHK